MDYPQTAHLPLATLHALQGTAVKLRCGQSKARAKEKDTHL
ncbi:uncharacterized protein METZ01_LOCUS353787 [marine metagenome]|uniref:Uncharacterized protein n=1 Tax=marine metagenome TaxID=408172 RepID=A0A382RTC3_9ZZZZ